MHKRTTSVGSVLANSPATAGNTVVCPDWCVNHRVNSLGWRFHLSELEYAGGLLVGLQQNVKIGGPAVAVFHQANDDSPIAVMDSEDSIALSRAVLDAAARRLVEPR
jgi:hypothetical protein